MVSHTHCYKQIAHELLNIDVKISQEPEGLMPRIGHVIKTADISVNKQSLVQLQAKTFMNKIYRVCACTAVELSVG